MAPPTGISKVVGVCGGLVINLKNIFFSQKFSLSFRAILIALNMITLSQDFEIAISE